MLDSYQTPEQPAGFRGRFCVARPHSPRIQPPSVPLPHGSTFEAPLCSVLCTGPQIPSGFLTAHLFLFIVVFHADSVSLFLSL